MSTKTEPIPDVELMLAHCGELKITEKKISGWFQPIPLKLWLRIVGFHSAISMQHKAESVSYHRFNPKTGQYDTIIPYQESTGRGLAVSTDWTSEKNVALLNRYAEKHGCEFFPANTIHTHVDAGAFESGTDAGDEKDLPGWHITIGHLVTYKALDLHCRFRLPKLPKIKKLTSVGRSYDLDAKNLFERGVDLKDIVECDRENTHWHRHLDRVSIR